MKVPVRRFLLAGLMAGGLGLAMPAVALADDTPATSTLRSPVPPATQVSVVPVSGAATGGGEPERGGTDAALLIGVGIAAVAGSIGLFAAAQVAGRRD